VAGTMIQAGAIHAISLAGAERVRSPLRPRLLPPDVPFFTGRTTDLATLDAMLETGPADGTGPGTPMPVMLGVIVGAGGIGKTSLALHWAHQVQSHFPDGQLYVDLHGYGPSHPLTPEQALDGFLRALGLPGESIPHELDQMSGIYRSLLADRRVLILLDNARTVQQIHPLLPSTPTCLILVTSRTSLSGLIARNGARRLILDQLSTDESVSLLRDIIGPDRVDAEPDTAIELAQLCAGLPLALRIIGERVSDRPHARIATLVSSFVDQRRLDVLAVEDDEHSAVRAAFDWSHAALPPDTARTFRRLGLHPGPTIGLAAATVLTDTTPATLQPQLAALTRSHLLTEIDDEHYRFHELIRDYAAEQAASHDPDTDLRASIHRLGCWYLLGADTAARLLYPHGYNHAVPPARQDVPGLPLTSRHDALRWFDTEYSNLVATIHDAARHGDHDIAARLPSAIGDYLALRARWPDMISGYTIALASATALHDTDLILYIQACLTDAYFYAGRWEESALANQQVLTQARAVGNRKHEASALHMSGMLASTAGQLPDAVNRFQAALALYRELGNPRGEALMLGMIGDSCRQQHHMKEALDYLNRSLMIFRATGNRWNEAGCLLKLAATAVDSHRLDHAETHLRDALAIYHELDDRHEVAQTMHALGDTLALADQPGPAGQAWRDAAMVYQELNIPPAPALCARLGEVISRNTCLGTQHSLSP
jgi:tetratricopeptide (TPR) repeat protein